MFRRYCDKQKRAFLPMLCTKDILERIATAPKKTYKKRHSYVIIGKPGCGKTTLATKLAKLTNNQIINLEEIATSIQSNLKHPVYQQVSVPNIVGRDTTKWRRNCSNSLV
jgi:replication-associated recombination protein RarA